MTATDEASAAWERIDWHYGLYPTPRSAMPDDVSCPLRPLADRVVVVRAAPPATSRGGILLPGGGSTRKDAKVHEGVVAAVGPGTRLADGTFGGPPSKPDGSPLAVGDRVLFTTLGGHQEERRGDRVWVLLNEHDLLAVLD